MSASKQTEKIQLDVETKDKTADIYVIDSLFRVVERGRGTEHTFHLKPGLYTVKTRVGFESREQNVILIDEPQKTEFEAIEFPSAIPLADTARTHEYHIAAAVTESKKIHLKKGEGSQIFIFARDWKPTDSGKRFKITSLPHKNLKLKKEDGEVIADLEKDAVSDNSNDAWAACNIELAPGQYRLSVKIDSKKTIEQTIVACPGWQTQVFLLQKNYKLEKSENARRADLTNTGILMSRGGFDPQNPTMRLLDLARLGLAHNRQILPEKDVNEILQGKFENPMLGILGAHLLLKSKKSNIKLLEIVVKNLRRLLGKGTHPDVEALALRLENKKTEYNFDLPPMLRHSWTQIVDLTTVRPDLIPPDSFTCRNDVRMLGDEPWLLYLSGSQEAVKSAEDSVRYFVQKQLNAEQSAPAAEYRELRQMLPQSEIPVSSEVEFGSFSSDDSEKTTEEASEYYPAEKTAQSEPTIGDRMIKNLVSDTGLPKAKIMQILERIE